MIRLQRRAHFFCFLFFKKGNIEKLKLVGNPLFKFWFDFANKMRNESLSHSYFPICASFLDLSRTRFVFNVNNLLHQMKFRLFCFFYVGRKCNEPHPFGLMLLKWKRGRTIFNLVFHQFQSAFLLEAVPGKRMTNGFFFSLPIHTPVGHLFVFTYPVWFITIGRATSGLITVAISFFFL